MSSTKPVIYHIPVCPFSQRVEILLALKGLSDTVRFKAVDITKPRAPDLLAKTRGTTALPVLETPDGRIIKESLVILRYFEDMAPTPPVARQDPYERAIENMLIAHEGELTNIGYRFVMNRDRAKADAMRAELVKVYGKLDDFLAHHAPQGDFLFERFGMAETVFTPLFMRFWFNDYYEGFEIPEHLPRVRRWVAACLACPAAQQTSREEIVKLYYDYAQGMGNGALPPGRSVSSFTFEPNWRQRPWPPRDKWTPATDVELGLV